MLVSNYYDVLHWELAVVIILVYPLIKVIETLLACDIEDQDAAVRPPVVARRQRSKSLLACRVPDLQSDFVISVSEGLRSTIDTNSRIIGPQSLPLALPDTHKQGSLTCVGVPDDNNLIILVIALEHVPNSG